MDISRPQRSKSSNQTDDRGHGSVYHAIWQSGKNGSFDQVAVMRRATLLVACLSIACSGEQDGDANQTVTPAKNPAAQTPSPPGGKTAAPPPVVAAPERRGYDPPLLFVKDSGVHYEIFEHDEHPYDGKIVTYHDNDKKLIASERVFEKGRLAAEHEYWPNAKLKLEITYNLGSTNTVRYDQQGNVIKPPVATTSPTPQYRSLNWTYNYNAGTTRLEALKNTSLLLQYLGEPNDKLNNAWTYRNMRITDGRTRRQYTTVRFNISANTVSSIDLLQ